jgi:glycine cleavage system regulatory protein
MNATLARANSAFRNLVLEGEFFTAPLTTDSQEVAAVLTCSLMDQVVLVNVEGFDRPGILFYVAELFERFEVNIESCEGKRLLHAQGSRFELSHSRENKERVRGMCDALVTAKAPPFVVRPVVGFDRVFDLDLMVKHDRSGLLVPLAKFLAERDVNLRSFDAHRDDRCGLLTDPEVRVRARLEVPHGLDTRELHAELLAVCPAETSLTLTEVWKLVDGKPARGNVVLVHNSN